MGHPRDLISHGRRGVAFARESLQDPQISRGLPGFRQGHPPPVGPPWAQVVSGWRKSPWPPQFPGQFPGQHSASTCFNGAVVKGDASRVAGLYLNNL